MALILVILGAIAYVLIAICIVAEHDKKQRLVHTRRNTEDSE